MKRSTLSVVTLISGSTAALVLLAGGALLGQETLTGNAKFCDDFDQNVIIMGKLDEAPKYVTEDFKEHNLGLQADGMKAFVDKMKERAAGRAGGGGGRGRGRGGPAPARTVEQSGDLVMFYTLRPERDDPNNPGKKIPASTHFDIYKLRGGKIAEHWD
jgi:predicted SnoaL-like aldol condensation-catalyzing enzyme